MTTASTHPGYVYDLGVILGKPSADPLPAPESGYFLVRVPQNLSLHTISMSPLGQQLMHQQEWYRTYNWSTLSIEPGLYCLRLPNPR